LFVAPTTLPRTEELKVVEFEFIPGQASMFVRVLTTVVDGPTVKVVGFTKLRRLTPKLLTSVVDPRYDLMVVGASRC
jgi:hypothetical protein